MKSKYRFSLVIIVILLVITTSLGSSYALWSVSKTQPEANNIATANCFQLTNVANDSTNINLTDTYPLTDQKGLLTTPHIITVTNNCNVDIPFRLYLHTLTAEANAEKPRIPDQYIRASVVNGASTVTNDLTTFTADANYQSSLQYHQSGSNTNTNGTINNSYILTSGTIASNETKTFSIRLWIKEGDYGSTLNADGSTTYGTDLMNKSFEANVSIDADSRY